MFDQRGQKVGTQVNTGASFDQGKQEVGVSVTLDATDTNTLLEWVSQAQQALREHDLEMVGRRLRAIRSVLEG